MRIDSHQHFWRYSAQHHAWLDDSMSALRRDFMPPELQALVQAEGVDGSVAVQVGQTHTETQFLLGLADAYPFIRGVVGWVDLRARELEGTLAELADHARFKGVRHIAQAEPQGFLAQPAFRAGVASLARFDLSYDVLVYAHQLPEAVDFARALPDVRLVLDHLAKPPVRKAELEPWRTQVQRLAELPNVYCKLSGLVTEADWSNWQPRDLVPFIDTVVECFGPSRVMVGSDWPVCTLAGSYADVLNVFRVYFAGFSAAEQAAIFGGNAERAYRLSA
jgi:L-fuconolactonase